MVTARDGYAVALALADTDPMVHPVSVILADQADGVPPPVSQGPYRLVIDGDLRGARPARKVTEISVIRPAVAP
jgi:hypothetical protein